jgi:hypothetical protein
VAAAARHSDEGDDMLVGPMGQHSRSGPVALVGQKLKEIRK